jgi:hypothetical protein
MHIHADVGEAASADAEGPELAMETYMTGSSPDLSYFQDGTITAAATPMVHQILRMLNHSASLAVCASCKETASVLVGTTALCAEHATPYEYSTHLPVRCHVCPFCEMTVVTGQVFQDLSSPTPFEPDLLFTASLHKHAIDAHNDVCEQFPITVCEGVNKRNMHEHVCENPRCSIMIMKKKE